MIRASRFITGGHYNATLKNISPVDIRMLMLVRRRLFASKENSHQSISAKGDCIGNVQNSGWFNRIKMPASGSITQQSSVSKKPKYQSISAEGDCNGNVQNSGWFSSINTGSAGGKRFLSVKVLIALGAAGVAWQYLKKEECQSEGGG